jgi:hypothetical protein
LNSDTSCGIAVIFTVLAVYRPSPPPSAIPTTMIAQAVTLMPSLAGSSSSSARMRIAVAPTATAMPPAESRFPLRAVAGEFMRMSPMTNAAAPISQAIRTRTSMIPRVSMAYASAWSAAGFGATGFLRNIWSMRSVTT